MGRYAQRRRGGGASHGANHIVFASVTGTDTILVQYNLPIDVAVFSGGDFFGLPSGEDNQSQVQVGLSSIELTMSGNISTDTQLLYSGATPGIVTPQTVTFPT